MAITSSELQAELGADPIDPRVVRDFGIHDSLQHWYVIGGDSARGRARLVSTTASDNAATQAASVLSTLQE